MSPAVRRIDLVHFSGTPGSPAARCLLATKNLLSGCEVGGRVVEKFGVLVQVAPRPGLHMMRVVVDESNLPGASENPLAAQEVCYAVVDVEVVDPLPLLDERAQQFLLLRRQVMKAAPSFGV